MNIRIELISILSLWVTIGCNDSQNIEEPIAGKEVLLVGTFHYNNPGADVAKTKSFDILSENSQRELEQISKDIMVYAPTKIFVEWPYDEQQELDSLYTLYRNGKYFENDSLSNFYLKNEIFQLAFRTAKANNLEKLYGIDYSDTEFPYNEVMEDIQLNDQLELKDRIEGTIADLTTDFDNMIDSGASLKKLMYAMNTKKFRSTSNDLHNNMFPLAGSPTEFNGVYLTSQWYKRNLYMWSLVQKYTLNSDQRVMVLVGASHAAMLELFIDGNSNWQVKELEDVLIGDND